VIDVFFAPKSIAVFGASREEGKPGRVVFDNLVNGGFKGQVYPVNPKATEIGGCRVYSLKELPKVDLGIFVIPAPFVPGAIREAAGKIKAALVISGGFGESGNTELDKELGKVVNETGLRIFGPNCLGIINTAVNMNATFLPEARAGMPKPGRVSILSQSGATVSAMVDKANALGIGMSKIASYGNQLDVSDWEILDYLQRDPETDVIGFYVEGLRDGKKILEVAKTSKKPVIVLKAGRTGKGIIAAKSHTGALAGNYEVFRGVSRQVGWKLAEGFDEFLLLLKARSMWSKKVNSAGIVTCGGGFGVMVADSLEATGLDVPQVPENVKSELSAKFPKRVSVSNPIDLTGDATKEMFELAIGSLLGLEEIDAVVVVVLAQLPGIDESIVPVIKKFSDGEKPVIVVSPGGEFADSLNYKMKGLLRVGSPYFAAKVLSALKP
jgi:acyl-CoA synthetase (NDP forming)